MRARVLAATVTFSIENAISAGSRDSAVAVVIAVQAAALSTNVLAAAAPIASDVCGPETPPNPVFASL